MPSFRAALLGAVLAAATPWQVFAQFVRVSVATDGSQANSFSGWPSISADGRYVAFQSEATNLVPGDTNDRTDVFLRDRDTDGDGIFDELGAVATTLVSALGSTSGNESSHLPRITPDGRFVAFLSFATDLVSGSVLPTGVLRVYRYDRQTGRIELVSVSTQGQPSGTCTDMEMSDDGQVLVVACGDPAIAPGELGFGSGIFVRDLAAGTTIRVSEIQPPPFFFLGFTVFSAVGSPTISGNGRFVGFTELTTSYRSALAWSRRGSITLVDRVTGVTSRAVAAATDVTLAPDGSAFVARDLQSLSPAAYFRQDLTTGARLDGRELNNDLTGLSPDGRAFVHGAAIYDFDYGRSYLLSPELSGVFVANGALSRSGRVVAFGAAAESLVPGDTNGESDIFVADLDVLFDQDADALDDRWELFFGLSIAIGAGDDGPGGDPDGDGLRNAHEKAAGSHPRGTFIRYFAEGAAGAFFQTRIAAANPDPTNAAAAVLRFERRDGTSVSQHVPVAAGGRTTSDPGAAAGMDTEDFATVIESDRPLVVDRLMAWDASRYGSHAETAIVSPSATWFLAEGTTVRGFQLFYLLQNPHSTAVTASVRYLLPTGPPLVRTYELSARSRTTIYVNMVPTLGQTDVSAEITATQPIVVERAMYRSRDGQPFALGHAASAVPQASASWFLAEGATGTFFDTYVLVTNPSSQPASVQVDFLRDGGGAVSHAYDVAANSRFSIYVDGVAGMASTSFGARVTSTVPVVVERAMYWAGGYFDYYEGHVSAATTQTGSRWVLAEGEVGGPAAAETYVLIANTGSAPASASLSVMLELPQPFSMPTPLAVMVPANGRVSVALSTMIFGSTPVFRHVRAGVDVRETGASPAGALVVEGAVYWNAGGQLWGAGASLPATRVP